MKELASQRKDTLPKFAVFLLTCTTDCWLLRNTDLGVLQQLVAQGLTLRSYSKQETKSKQFSFLIRNSTENAIFSISQLKYSEQNSSTNLKTKVQVINVYMQLISIPNVTLCTVKAQLYYMKIIKKCTLGGGESNLIISSDFVSKETPNYCTVTS